MMRLRIGSHIRSRRALRLVLGAVLALAGAVGVGSGCQTQTQSTSSESGTKLSERPEHGEPCVRDSGCGQVLRCLDGTCDVPPAVAGEPTEDTPVVLFRAQSDADADADQTDAEHAGSTVASFHVEIADTTAERSRGLMYRDTLADGWGMLFVYPDEAKRSFWMKNTYIPLDMIFISDAGRVVNVVHDTEPQSESLYSSSGPARYVLEVNAGTAESVGIEAGMQVRMDNLASRHRPAR